MDKVIAVVFNNETRAYEGLRAIRELHHDGHITIYDDAVVVKDASGNVATREVSDGSVGTVVGLLTGSLIGVLGGPVGVAVGASTGTLAGAAFDLSRAGINADFVDEISASLLPGTAAVLAEVDEDWQAPIDGRMEALGGHVFRRNRIDVEDAYFARQDAAFREELRALDAERQQAAAERKARLDAKIAATRHTLQEKQGAVKARVDAITREGEARIELLQKQAADAREETKERVKERLAAARADYGRRSETVHQAWELTKSALR
jgi:uncharacterized membrane protein